MRCIIHQVRRNSGSIAANFEENTAHFSQLEIIRLIQSILGLSDMSVSLLPGRFCLSIGCPNGCDLC